MVKGSLRLLEEKRAKGGWRAEDVAGERHCGGGLFGVATMERCNERLVANEH
jgi:hypothetical protein